MTYSEIKELSDKELKEILQENRTKLTKMKLNHKVSDIESPIQIRHTRRHVARLITELNARKNDQKA